MDNKKQALRIKTNVRAGCGEDAPPPPVDPGTDQPLSSRNGRISRLIRR